MSEKTAQRRGPAGAWFRCIGLHAREGNTLGAPGARQSSWIIRRWSDGPINKIYTVRDEACSSLPDNSCPSGAIVFINPAHYAQILRQFKERRDRRAVGPRHGV